MKVYALNSIVIFIVIFICSYTDNNTKSTNIKLKVVLRKKLSNAEIKL